MSVSESAQMSSQIYLKEKSNSYSAYSYSGIRPIEHSVSVTMVTFNVFFFFEDVHQHQWILLQIIRVGQGLDDLGDC